MRYDNRGWGPNGDGGRSRGGSRKSRNPSTSRAHDSSTNAPVDPRAARGNNMTGAAAVPALTSFLGPFYDYPDFWAARTGSTGNVDKEQATTPDVSKGIWGHV